MPKCVVAISGKRKSGKDYCTKLLKERLEENGINVQVTGISNSLKEEYARIHGLNFSELLSDGPYKEKYRKEMIKWGEEVRSQDSAVFCRASLLQLDADVIIVSDCRRSSDYRFFVDNYRTLTLRIETSEEDRKSRGFRFVQGVDDAESECGLDNSDFDLKIVNLNGSNISEQLERVVERIEQLL